MNCLQKAGFTQPLIEKYALPSMYGRGEDEDEIESEFGK